jgi:serine/threonine-protein kinase HipA
VADRLIAWLYDTPVVSISSAANLRVTIDWELAGIERWGLGSRALSVSLPLGSPIRPRDDTGMDFFSNLLPEGPVLVAMATLAGVSPVDTYGLLSRFGSDCAGALVIVPEGVTPPDRSDWGYEALTLVDIAHVIDNLATVPFGADIDQGWSPSLPGYQGKVLLGRFADGTWARPLHGAPSTWILKPDRDIRMAENEATCLRLAASCGIPVPDVELLTVSGAKVLAIARYDRDETHGSTRRIHQEDGCQATGMPPMLKYESDGGPPLTALAELLRNYGTVDSLRELLARITFNVAIGNADAHAKNFSILHAPADPTVDIAPAYDLISTIALDPRRNAAGQMVPASTRMGQQVDGVRDVGEVSRANLVSEGTKWGIGSKAATQVVDEMLGMVRRAVRVSGGNRTVLATIETQLDRLA